SANQAQQEHMACRRHMVLRRSPLRQSKFEKQNAQHNAERLIASLPPELHSKLKAIELTAYEACNAGSGLGCIASALHIGGGGLGCRCASHLRTNRANHRGVLSPHLAIFGRNL